MAKGGGITQLGAAPAADPFANAPGFYEGTSPGDTDDGAQNAAGDTDDSDDGGDNQEDDIDSQDPSFTDFGPDQQEADNPGSTGDLGDNGGDDPITYMMYDGTVIPISMDPGSLNSLGDTGSNDPPDTLSDPIEDTPLGPSGPRPREFGNSDFYAQYPRTTPTFGDLLDKHDEVPEENTFNYAGIVYTYDPESNTFIDRNSGTTISATNNATGTTGIAGLYG